MRYFKNIQLLLAMIMGLPIITACNDDDTIDYTEYYDWRDENNRIYSIFYDCQQNDGVQTYFDTRIDDLKEPVSYYPNHSFVHYVHHANLDSLRALNPRKDYHPFSTSTVSVHYTLFRTDSLYQRVKEQGGWSKEYLRNHGGIVDSLFFANLYKSPLKADTLESYQVQFYSGFTPNSVINGWGDILQQMYIGDHVVCMIPWFLAYGQTGSGSIDPYTNLFFRIELCDITHWGNTVSSK